METLTYNISGEYITGLARTWFYDERRDYKDVERLLLSCMGGTDTPIETLREYALNILMFKQKFVGNTADNSFGLVDEDPNDTQILRKQCPLYKYVDSLVECGKTPFEVCEYGFIEPKGKYIPVDWGEHAEYAIDWADNNVSSKEFMKSPYSLSATDYLVYDRGWVLIDNPQRGIGIAILPPKMSKKQRETLYDYYIYHNRIDEARSLYNEEE